MPTHDDFKPSRIAATAESVLIADGARHILQREKDQR
jgi:hypothetical protein